MRRALLGILVALLAAVSIYAYIPSRYYVSGLFTYWTKTDTSLAVNLDTANALTRQYILRIADSAAANRAGQAKDYIVYRMYGVLGSAASDSVNLQVGVNGVYEAILPNFAVYAFNFSLISTTPSTLISTFATDKPIMSTDSMYIVRVSRNASISPPCAVTILKVAKSAGPDINDKTTGVYYDEVRFADTILPAGANRFFTLDFALKRIR